MRGGHGTDTEVGRLRTVLVHRPGAELSRITPGNCAAFPFGRVPWLRRAQQEHDAFAGGLRVSHPRPFLEAAALAMGIES